MPDFAIHRTRFENYSDTALYGLYRESVFTNLSPSEKLDLMQETVNRDAALQGMKGAPEVVYGDLTSEFGGCYMDGVIYMNYELIVEGEGEYPNCQALNSVFHENIHAWQDQVADGTIPAVSPELRTQYRANDASTSVVKQNGSYKMGNQYLSGITSPYLYYFQALERDAKLGQKSRPTVSYRILLQSSVWKRVLRTMKKTWLSSAMAPWKKRQLLFIKILILSEI